MAGKPIGTIFVELDLDASKLTRKQRQIVREAKLGVEGIEKSFAALGGSGAQSDKIFNLMRERANKLYRDIATSSKASSQDIVRAAQLRDAELAKIDQQQFSRQSEVLSQVDSMIKRSGATYAEMRTAASNAYRQIESEAIRSEERILAAKEQQAQRFRAINEQERADRIRTVDDAWKGLGARSDREFDAMRASAVRNFELIKKAGIDSPEAIARAERMMHSEIKRLNEEQAAQEKETMRRRSRMTRDTQAGWISMAKGMIAYRVILEGINLLHEVFIGTFQRAVKAIDEFQISTAAMAGAIASGDFSGTFTEAYETAEELNKSVERLDRQFVGTADELRTLADAMITFGMGLDLSNAEAERQFVTFANTIKLLTRGQGFQRQVMQEVRALMEGANVQGAILVKKIEAAGYNAKAMIPLWKEQGVLMEKLNEIFSGYAESGAEIEKTWSAQKGTLETIYKKILREGFSKAYEDIVGWVTKFNDKLLGTTGLTREGERLAGMLSSAWEGVKTVVGGTATAFSTMASAFDKMKPAIYGVAAGLLVTKINLELIGVFIGVKFLDAIKWATVAMRGFTAAMIANPVAVAVAGSIALITWALKKNREEAALAREENDSFSEALRGSTMEYAKSMARNLELQITNMRATREALIEQRDQLKENLYWWEEIGNAELRRLQTEIVRLGTDTAVTEKRLKATLEIIREMQKGGPVAPPQKTEPEGWKIPSGDVSGAMDALDIFEQEVQEKFLDIADFRIGLQEQGLKKTEEVYMNELGAFLALQEAETNALIETQEAMMEARKKASPEELFKAAFDTGEMSDAIRILNEGLGETQAKLEGAQEYIQTYRDLFIEAHRSMYSYAAEGAARIYSSLSRAITNMVTGVQSAKEAFKELGKAMIQMIVDWIAKRIIASALSKVMALVEVGIGVATGAALAKAYAPAAYFASVATLGSAATIGAAALAAGFATSMSLGTASAIDQGGVGDAGAFPAGFQKGTDYVPKTMPAIVHEGERVVPAETNKELTEFLSGGKGIGDRTTIQLLLDGSVLAEWIHDSQRDGLIQLRAT